MRPDDYDSFVGEYKRLSAALERYKQSPQELAAKADAYFHVLKSHPLQDVIQKADQWLKTESKFPKPAEWASVIVRRAVALDSMTEQQAREYRRAELLRYEDAPCKCHVCVEAGVWQPIRFVPDVDYDGLDRRMSDPVFGRVVIAGHWAHGIELQRFYEAKAAFYIKAGEMKVGNPLKPSGRRHRTLSKLVPVVE